MFSSLIYSRRLDLLSRTLLRKWEYAMLNHVVIAYRIRSSSKHSLIWLAPLIGLILALILPARLTLAGPVAPIPTEITQPNGQVITADPFGDEWNNGYEYGGYTIVLDSVTGYWVYAEQNQSGILIPGQARAGLDQPPAVLLPHLRDSQAAQAQADALAAQPRTAPSVWRGALGTQKVLMLLVDFTPSVSRGTTEAQWSQIFFDGGIGARSVNSYYQQASFGKFDLAPATETFGTANDGVIRVTLNYAYPNPSRTGDSNRWITRNALLAADPYVKLQEL